MEDELKLRRLKEALEMHDTAEHQRAMWMSGERHDDAQVALRVANEEIWRVAQHCGLSHAFDDRMQRYGKTDIAACAAILLRDMYRDMRHVWKDIQRNSARIEARYRIYQDIPVTVPRWWEGSRGAFLRWAEEEYSR